jgi:hypothetical protein
MSKIRFVGLNATPGSDLEVIAPSLVPVKASDRVKTDRRDAVKPGAAIAPVILLTLEQATPHAPWRIRRADLEAEPVRSIVERLLHRQADSARGMRGKQSPLLGAAYRKEMR